MSFLRHDHRLTGFFILIGILGGCSNSQFPPSAAPDPRVAAPLLISESFSVHKDPQTGKAVVAIRKGALEKEFLLQSVIIEQPIAAMGSALKSRIVAFSRRENQVLMLEATSGHTVTEELPQTIVLGSFPVISETETEILIDFNSGARPYLVPDYHASDAYGTDYRPGFLGLNLRNHYLHSIRLASNNTLVIRQIGQALIPLITSDGANIRIPVEENIPVEVRYYLSPYHPDPGFKSSFLTDFDTAGFFETAPTLSTDGNTYNRVIKFNPKKNIVFAISASTPQAYRQAVKDGILYWNQAFGEEKIKVVDAPAGATAPDADYNIVQWISWDGADMAYADFQSDPRTGEILHAQVFMTSVFAFMSRAKARAILSSLDEQGQGVTGHRHSSRLNLHSLCRYDLREALRDTLSTLLTTEASETQVLKISQDVVRAVVAHEIGHTLGLRHNFAGSLGATPGYLINERDRMLKEYLNSDAVSENVVPSSSVMDYLLLEDEAFIGARMRKGQPMLSHDRKAIEILYRGKTPLRHEMPLFCTDTHVGKFVDCQRFDAGASLIEFSAWQVENRIKRLPVEVLEMYVNAKAPPPGMRPVSLEKVSFNPERVAEGILASRQSLIRGFSNGFLKVAREMPPLPGLNDTELNQAFFNYFSDEIRRVGGGAMQRVFKLAAAGEKAMDPEVPVLSLAVARARFEQFLENPGLTPRSASGEVVRFTEGEIQIIRNTTRRLFEKLPGVMAKMDQKIWSNAPSKWKVEGTPFAEMLTEILSERVEEYVFSTTENVLEVKLELPAAKKNLATDANTDEAGEKEPAPAPGKRVLEVRLPQFSYPREIRVEAPGLLSASYEKGAERFGVVEKQCFKRRFAEFAKSALGGDLDIAKLEVSDMTVVAPELSAEELKALQGRVHAWILDAQAVYKAF